MTRERKITVDIQPLPHRCGSDHSIEHGVSNGLGLDQNPSAFLSPFSVFNIILFVLIAVSGVAADLVTKEIVFRKLGMPGEYRLEEEPELFNVYWISPNILGFQTSLNQGALFGMGQGQVLALSILSGVFLLGIFGWLLHSARKNRLLTVTLGLIVAGILGNLYDRLGLHRLQWNNGEPVYAVRDWILVMLGSYPWPNFNIADSMLVCGAVLLVLHTFFTKDQP
jgi:signal peptidase II